MDAKLMKWACNRAKKIKKWNELIEIVDEYPFYARVARDTSLWGTDIIEKMNFVDKVKSANIIHLRFK